MLKLLWKDETVVKRRKKAVKKKKVNGICDQVLMTKLKIKPAQIAQPQSKENQAWGRERSRR